MQHLVSVLLSSLCCFYCFVQPCDCLFCACRNRLMLINTVTKDILSEKYFPRNYSANFVAHQFYFASLVLEFCYSARNHESAQQHTPTTNKREEGLPGWGSPVSKPAALQKENIMIRDVSCRNCMKNVQNAFIKQIIWSAVSSGIITVYKHIEAQVILLVTAATEWKRLRSTRTSLVV